MSPLLGLFPFRQKAENVEEPWEAKAAAKRASTLAKIPSEWVLQEDDLEKVVKQKDLTGRFIEKYLDEQDIAIIHEGSAALVAKLRRGDWSAVQVTRAFCKTAAIAHQIVSKE
jgi:amidase